MISKPTPTKSIATQPLLQLQPAEPEAQCTSGAPEALPKARSIQQIISDHNKMKSEIKYLGNNLRIIKTKNLGKVAASTKSVAEDSTKTQTTKKLRVITLGESTAKKQKPLVQSAHKPRTANSNPRPNPA